MRLIKADTSAICRGIAKKVMGKGTVAAADPIFFFQKIQLFFCGVCFLKERIDPPFAPIKAAAANQLFIDFILGNK